LESDQTTPTFFSFVLTNEEGNRLYGATLTIYEPLQETLRSRLEATFYLDQSNLLVPKALCIVSHHSFVYQFKDILRQLYRLHLSQSHIPIEVSNP